MKRKMDWDKEKESEIEDYSTSDEESDEEEPRIKDVLNNLSNAVSRKHASELLHSMAASKNILFWTPSGLLLRNQRAIPVTNISELVEYVLLPHNEDVAKPRALNTFLDGLAELGVNKRLIKNKKLLSDLLGKKKEDTRIRRTNQVMRLMMKTCRTAVKRRKPVLKIANLKSLITAAWKVIGEKTRPRIVATQLKIHQ